MSDGKIQKIPRKGISRFDLENPGCQLFDQVAIVRYDKDSAVKSGKGIFQYLTGVNVQMVGRFVQYQKIHAGKNQFCQCQARPFPTAEHTDGFVYVLADKAEKRQGVPDLGFGLARVGVP
ncbi:putative ATP-binding component of ABC transporter [Clostridium sp. CAG:448]|nr:putative ATP-binding component of ABC transporter [Clostridium sp. CAG:448]